MVDVPFAPAPEGVDPADWLAACDEVRALCGWHVAPVVTETITVDSDGGPLLVLPSLRVVDVTSVSIAGAEVAAPAWSSHGVIRGCWPAGQRNVAVTLAHGFDRAPAGLVALAKQFLTNPLAPGARVASRTRGPFAESYFDSGSPEQRVIDRYRLPRLA